ncbi:MAG: uroporphyrinogen-III synthase [Sulfuricurvum sp.]|nr:uroporphyrinogen-III synthase [Sulfuricurvum sp.]
MRPIYLISKTSFRGVIHLPVLSIRYLAPEIDFTRYEGIVVTSKQGALALGHYSPNWEKLHVVCVGESTAQAMKQLGAVHITIAEGYGDTIFNALKSDKQPKRWLYCRPKMIASSWPSRARDAGMLIDEVIIYETACNTAMEPQEIAEDGVLIFTSPSSIECFLKYYEILPTHSIVVIGTTTQNALPFGIPSTLSETTSVESCVEKGQKLAISSPF